MRPFIYRRTDEATEAIGLVASAAAAGDASVDRRAQYIAGGTNMTDYMRLNVVRPETLVDLNRLPDKQYGRIEERSDGLHLGSLVRMGEAEDHPVILRDYPVVADTLKLAATRQIRNMASLGGNVLQRTRCEYFRETSFACNKREPGSGCAAMDGINRQHAVLGVSDQCIASYPGDFAQALIALDATVELLGPKGDRRIKFAELHKLPGDSPEIETNLQPGELIAGYAIPAGPWTRRSLYVKVRDRQSYQFALTGAAVALHLEGDVVREVRIALGGVATVPWRAHAAEEILTGGKLDEDLAGKAAKAAFAEASPREHNAFKVPIGEQTIVRALMQAKSMQI